MKRWIFSLFILIFLIICTAFLSVSALSEERLLTQTIKSFDISASTLSVTSQITNNSNTTEVASGYAAVFNAQDSLKGIGIINNISVPSNNTKTFTYQIKNYTYSSGDFIKVFLWGNDYEPLSKYNKSIIFDKVTSVTAIPGDKSVTISWETVDGADGYCIYKHNGTEYKSYKFSDKSAKTFGGLTNGTEYFFTVAAYSISDNGEVYGPMSDPVSVTPVNSTLKMSDSALVLNKGESYQLYCRLNDENQNMIWSSSDPAVATVSDNGTVTAISKGYAKITAKLNNSTRSCKVFVDREAPAPKVSTASRYTKSDDGTYTNNQSSQSAILMFTGDIMALKPQMVAAKQNDGTYDFSPSFCYVADIFKQSDLVVGNLETTLSESFPYAEDSANYMGISNCNAPSSLLDSLKIAGFDALVTANNHYCDSGPVGLLETLDHLDEYNFMHNGTYRNAEESRVLLVDVNGIKVGILNYNQKSTNGKDSMFTDEQQKVMLGKFYRSRVPQNINQAREMGAEFIIVCIHYGKQNTVAITDTQSSITQYLADCGADLIVGAHPHMLQTFDTITSQDGRKVPVAYSLGNFFSHMAELDRNIYNVIFNVELKRESDGIIINNLSYTPCCILESTEKGSFVITPTNISENITDEQKITLKKAYDTIVSTMGPDIIPTH